MHSIISSIEQQNPVNKIYEDEYDRIFTMFCSYICIINGKKINLANIFLTLLKDEQIRDLYMHLSDIDTEYEAFKTFLYKDPTLYKSKYISNFLQENKLDI